MKVKVLGCHGGHSPGYDTSCYMINDRFLVDGGSICSTLSLDQQKNITDVVITHPHLDHIKDICFLLENTFHKDRKTLNLHSNPQILKVLKDHIFNDLIWPDFTQIFLNKDTPALKFCAIDQQTSIGGVQVSPFKVNHPSHAVGYVLDDGDSQVIFTGDSGPTPITWKKANGCSNLKAIFTEISFPSRLTSLAEASGHYTLKTLTEDLSNLDNKDTPIYISHFKPLFLEELLDEFQTDANDNMKPLHADDELQFL